MGAYKYQRGYDIPVKKCEIDGEIVLYNACSEHIDAYPTQGWKYIGKGKIVSVRGVDRVCSTTHYFWVY